MDYEQSMREALKKRAADALLRRARVYPAAGGLLELESRRMLNFSSNDYLDLAHHPVVIARAQAALEAYGAGTGSSRLVSGTLPIHEELEQRLAGHKGYPAALLFGSGYMTNAGVIPALAGRGDTIFADRLAHASMIDACALSGARLRRFRHNDPEHLEHLLSKAAPGRRLILCESIYSMDGDAAPLGALAERADRFGALLMVDEAHAGGVFGPQGCGRIRDESLEGRIAISMGTLSKAFGGYGGFVACSHTLREWFVNHARALIYTTAPPPAVVGAALGALDVLASEPDRGARLLANAEAFRKRLRAAGLDTLNSASQIVPVLIGDNARALRLAEKLRAEGLLAAAIRPPTVPPGTARLRLSITLAHAPEDLERAAEILIRVAAEEGIP